jgi:hypothetical protein
MIAMNISRLATFFAAVLMLSGCGRTAYETAPVHGRVTVDDVPLFQGRVLFTPVAKGEGLKAGRTALGKIDPDGNYRLTTYAPNDGAIVGEHWAIVINAEEDLPKGVPEFARVTLPGKVQVAAEKDNKIDLKFTRDEIKKYREDDR